MKKNALAFIVVVAFSVSAHATDNPFDNVSVDNSGLNNGTASSGANNHWLNFGGPTSGTSGAAIGSKRTSGTGQFGLDFYTKYLNRMRIWQLGGVSIGGTNDPGTGKLSALGLLAMPAPSSNGQGLHIEQSPSGTVAPDNWAFNELLIGPETTNYGPDVFVSGLHIGYGFGGASTTGGRLALDASLSLDAPTDGSNRNRNYVAGNFQAAANSGDGGTAPTVFNSKGSVFAITPTIRARTGATNLEQISGMEIDINAEQGSSMRWKNGIIINYNSNDYVGGTEQDNMISLCRYNGAGTGTLSTTLGAKVGIEFGYGDGNGNPIRTNGTLIKATSSSNPTVWNGIDFYDYNITNNLIQGKYSSLGDQGGVFIGAGAGSTFTNVAAQGGAADVDIKISTKGNGVIQVGNAANLTGAPANPNVVRKWLKVKDSAGAVYYTPLYQ